jgi:hypothetical protein
MGFMGYALPYVDSDWALIMGIFLAIGATLISVGLTIYKANPLAKWLMVAFGSLSLVFALLAMPFRLQP